MELKLAINNEKYVRKFLNIWKLRNMLLKDQISKRKSLWKYFCPYDNESIVP
jgi:hypothetical protein